jgi:lambda family phage tail tape measure protein
MMLDTDFGTVTMTEKEKAISERQGHFTEMASAALMDYADEAEKTATKTYQAFQKAFKGIEDSLVDFVMNGKLEWRSLAESIIADIVRIQIQTSITGPMAKGIAPKSSGGGGWLSTAFNFVKDLPIFSAQGNMFNRYGLIPFATGGIVTKPTMFAFGQGGIGVMGEAGTEAIMPVTRTPSGDLGVKAIVGSGMTVNIYEAPGTKVTAEKSEDGNSLNILVEQLEGAMLGRMQRDTGLAKYMDTRYKRNR